MNRPSVTLRLSVNRQRVPHWRLVRVGFALWTIATAFDCPLQFDRQGDKQGTANKARLDAAQFRVVHGRLPTVCHREPHAFRPMSNARHRAPCSLQLVRLS
jgi:hypothetical protein